MSTTADLQCPVFILREFIRLVVHPPPPTHQPHRAPLTTKRLVCQTDSPPTSLDFMISLVFFCFFFFFLFHQLHSSACRQKVIDESKADIDLGKSAKEFGDSMSEVAGEESAVCVCVERPH